MLEPSETELRLNDEQLRAWFVSKCMIVATVAKLVMAEKQETMRWKVSRSWSVTGIHQMQQVTALVHRRPTSRSSPMHTCCRAAHARCELNWYCWMFQAGSMTAKHSCAQDTDHVHLGSEEASQTAAAQKRCA